MSYTASLCRKATPTHDADIIGYTFCHVILPVCTIAQSTAVQHSAMATTKLLLPQIKTLLQKRSSNLRLLTLRNYASSTDNLTVSDVHSSVGKTSLFVQRFCSS